MASSANPRQRTSEVVRQIVGHLPHPDDQGLNTIEHGGESVSNFETFEGDDPEDSEPVCIDGSFKVGRDGDKPGILMLADPMVGDVYSQEFSLSNAEDAVETISTTGTESVSAASYTAW